MKRESTDQDPGDQPALPKWWYSTFRLSMIAIVTTALCLVITIPISRVISKRVNQSKLDALQLYQKKQAAFQPSEVIHILNTHYVTPEVYATDLKNQDSTLTQKQIDKQYLEYLKGVNAAQKEQVSVLRSLIKEHKLKSVYIEGLTDKNYEEIMESIEFLKKYEKTKEDPPEEFLELFAWQAKLILGAAGQLVVEGELETLLITEDSGAMEAANPIQSDGKAVFDKKADERYEDAIVRNLLKGKGVVVIVLGGDHDLSDNLNRLAHGVKYKRVAVPKFKEFEKPLNESPKNKN
ncbi:hypothetical protein [uncultured Gimesia sp.]|uniref:hypothetical protein n=1 Tax=uncultured Gimesia sp. TaxID=1678688 RepID=UPI00262E24FD|nr:hypothetical protein [uncultured Gimesia sp.]